MKNSMLTRRVIHAVIPACTAFLLGGAVASCQDDLLTGQPSYLGKSIYEELEERGNFKETLKLIQANGDDYVSMLRKTGSKTLFVADDEAWAEFYESNPWGVKSIDEMTDAQKQLIFMSNMIDQAYLVELLGNIPASSATSDPEEGACMRRVTSLSVTDTKCSRLSIRPVWMLPQGNKSTTGQGRVTETTSSCCRTTILRP